MRYVFGPSPPVASILIKHILSYETPTSFLFYEVFEGGYYMNKGECSKI